jgi:hypothetical protein
MRVTVVKNADGQVVATASAEAPQPGEARVEPDLAEGLQVEVVEVSIRELSDAESFYASRNTG